MVSALDATGTLPLQWRDAFLTVPRHLFLPPVYWAATQDGYVRRDLYEESAPWLADLEVGHGMRVLEIGTGTGWSSALLTHRLGDGRVVTVETDEAVAAQARTALNASGLHPLVVHGDGRDGYLDGAPYDRVISTVSVREIPAPWLKQTRPGGLIVTPVSPLFGGGAIARLTVGDDGTASGHFTRSSAFMLLRQQRYRAAPVDDYLPGEWPGDSSPSTTSLDLKALPDYWTALFAIALRLPDVYYRRGPEEGSTRTWWIFDAAVTSWATVDYVRGQTEFEVRQSGPRRLWDEVEAAYDVWAKNGYPGYDRHGLTVTPDGQRAWLDQACSTVEGRRPQANALRP
jgi:protein-L-isoaspartate O-methyltransferase